MKSLSTLFLPYPPFVAKRYLSRAISIQSQLARGVHYQQLGGKQLILCRNLVRFKLGVYRLIVERTTTGFEPIFLLQRKNLGAFLNRRCGRVLYS